MGLSFFKRRFLHLAVVFCLLVVCGRWLAPQVADALDGVFVRHREGKIRSRSLWGGHLSMIQQDDPPHLRLRDGEDGEGVELPTYEKDGYVLVARMSPRPDHPQAAAAAAIPPALSHKEELKAWEACPTGYPYYVALGPVLHSWTADEADPPPEFAETLRTFDFAEESGRELAEKYRDCEVPFKVKHAAEILETSDLWTDAYLNRTLAGNTDVAQEVQVSATNRFMYWRHSVQGPPGWRPPTHFWPRPTFGGWLPWAKRADAEKLPAATEHLYFGADEPERKGENGEIGMAPALLMPRDFVARDMPYFSVVEPNFWVPNPAGRSGIQCRFSMRGVVAASHFDNGRNFVAMLRGAKRYLLNPPGTCPYLGIVMDIEHPSYRHTDAFWSWRWPEGFDRAAAIDTVVGEGEALYIPSFWFHHVQSTKYSIQCNVRSGFPPRNEGLMAIKQCLRLSHHEASTRSRNETAASGSGEAAGSGSGSGGNRRRRRR